MMVDAISSPTGAVFARPTESFRGHGDRRAHEDERELVLEEISRDLEPGVTLVIAEIADPDPGVLDSTLDALGGTCYPSEQRARSMPSSTPQAALPVALEERTHEQVP